MGLAVFSEMEKRDLLKYLEFLLKQYRVLDAWWFPLLEKKCGTKAAERINGEAWDRALPAAASDLKRDFVNGETGMAGLEKILTVFPCALIGGHQIERVDNGLFRIIAAEPYKPCLSRLLGMAPGKAQV